MNLFRFTIIDDIGREGRGHVFDGQHVTHSVFYYRLPNEWQLVP
jgi:hypothetical protein